MLGCRPALESTQDRATLSDYEARRLLNAIVKEFVQMTAEDMEQQASEENRYALFGFEGESIATDLFLSRSRK